MHTTFLTTPVKKIRSRWRDPGGYREVLKIAIPLILSTSSWSIQHFVDRTFLTWYSPEAIAASLPAGMLNWVLISLFVGTASYTNTFVAQYYGAGQYRRVGAAVWQGIYLSVLGSIIVLPFFWLAEPVFALAGHETAVMELEVSYFQILLVATPFIICSHAATSFFSGLGRTWMVMWLNMVVTGVNLVLDYLLIFGNFGFPEMGMQGAAWASVAAMVVSAILFLLLLIRQKNNRDFNTRSGWRFDPQLFRRLLRFGIPTGLQMVLEVAAFAIFILMVGKLGVLELASSSIAFNINTLAFMPMFGMTIAVSTLVGQKLGDNQPELARYATWSTFHLATFYFCSIGFFFFVVPELFLWPFAQNADPAEFVPIADMVSILLKFIAFYCLFDGGNMIFSGALKGAGDTRFVAVAGISLAVFLLVLPSTLAIYVFNAGIYWQWSFVTLYIAGMCLVFWLRFRKGKWQSMRVIESAPGDPDAPDNPLL